MSKAPTSLKTVEHQTELFEYVTGKYIAVYNLIEMIEDVEDALFFAAVNKMDHKKLTKLIGYIRPDLESILQVLQAPEGTYSETLQEYIVETLDDIPDIAWTLEKSQAFAGPPKPQLLDKVWELAEVGIAPSIQKVADTLRDLVANLPGKKGRMVYQHMRKINRNRPTIGTYEAGITRGKVEKNLILLDVSGSMTESAVKALIDDVVALGWTANATMAIVSNHTFAWNPGTYSSQGVLEKAEFGGTRYETLKELFQDSWDTVITIADYDSSESAARIIAQCPGRVGQVLDLSLVSRPSFMAQTVGQLSDKPVKPLLIGTRRYL